MARKGDAIRGSYVVKTIRPTIGHTTDFNDGDVLFEPIEITDAVAYEGGVCKINMVTVIDLDNQANNDFTFIFQSSNQSYGSANAAEAISKADLMSAGVCAMHKVLGDDKNTSLSSARIITHQDSSNIGHTPGPYYVKAEAGSTSIYIAGICESALTLDAANENNLQIILGIEY